MMPAAAGQVAGMNLYERVNGETRMVAVDSAGAAINDCGSVLGTYNLAAYASGTNIGYFGEAPSTTAVSKDGSRVYFSTPDRTPVSFEISGFEDPDCNVLPQVYLREGGESVDVSSSRRSTPDPQPAIPSFQGAGHDGSVAQLLSDEALTEDASLEADRMLYRFDASDDSLTLITPTGVVDGVAWVSSDGSHVFYLQGRAP